MMRVIAAFGREEYEHRRFCDQTASAVAARVRLTVHQTIFSLAVNMITAVGSALVLGLGAYHVMQGRLTVGQMLVVIAYIAAIYKPLETISFTVGSLQNLFVSLKTTFDCWIPSRTSRTHPMPGRCGAYRSKSFMRT